MAIIPTYDNPQVQTTAISTPMAQAASLDTFGASLGKALETTGATVSSIVARATVQNNLETAQKFQAFAGQVGVETEAQIKAVQGEAALPSKDDPQGGLHPILSDYDKKVSDWLQKNTSNGQQSAYLSNKAQEYRNQVEGTMLSHELEQKKVVQEQAYTGAQSVIFDAISVTAADPNRQEDYNKAYDDGVANVNAYAIAHGVPDAKHQALLDDFEQKATTIKAKQMLHLNPVAAKEFIEENKDILGTEYTGLKDAVQLVAADQTGINAAEEISGRLYKEDYTTLRGELFKKFGGGTDAFDYRAFKVAEGQLAANNQAVTIAKKQNLDKLTVPIYQAILDTEKTGAKMSPATLSTIPEYQSMMTSGDPEVVKEAAVLMDRVWTENHAVVAEQRALKHEQDREAKYDRQLAKSDAAAAKAAKIEGQRNTWMEFYGNPDRVASMSKAEVMQTALTLGAYGDDLLKMHAKATSPEALASLKVEASTFKAVMEQLHISKDRQGSVQEALKVHLVNEQKADKRVMNKDQIRAAIGAAIQDVTVNTRTKDWFGDGYSPAGTITKKLYEVENPASIIIPAESISKITPLLKAYGITDTQANRLKIYKSMLSMKGGK